MKKRRELNNKPRFFLPSKAKKEGTYSSEWKLNNIHGMFCIAQTITAEYTLKGPEIVPCFEAFICENAWYTKVRYEKSFTIWGVGSRVLGKSQRQKWGKLGEQCLKGIQLVRTLEDINSQYSKWFYLISRKTIAIKSREIFETIEFLNFVSF